MELQKPKHLISLATSGMLVSVDVNVWSATKQDRGISNEVTTAKHADRNAGKYVKNLLADHPKHKAIVNYRQTIYNWVKRRTYRWNNAQDYLPSVDMPKFKQEWHEHQTAFETSVNTFIADYDSIVSDMAFKQGDMFNRDDYPSREELAYRSMREGTKGMPPGAVAGGPKERLTAPEAQPSLWPTCPRLHRSRPRCKSGAFPLPTPPRPRVGPFPASCP